MKTPIRLIIDQLETPTGRFAIVVDESFALRAAGWYEGQVRMEKQLEKYVKEQRFSLAKAKNPGGVSDAMRSYFEGELDAIDRLSVAAEGTTFQCAVWRALREIPTGATCSYGELARRIGNPTAVRAVGLANGA